jgi:hypothetical protein
MGWAIWRYEGVKKNVAAMIFFIVAMEILRLRHVSQRLISLLFISAHANAEPTAISQRFLGLFLFAYRTVK